MKNKNKSKYTSTFLSNRFSPIAALTVVLIIIVLGLGITRIFVESDMLLYALVGIVPGFAIIELILLYVLVKKTRKECYENLYLTTAKNIDAIKSHRVGLAEYAPIKNLDCETLNDSIKQINNDYKNLSIGVIKSDYSGIDLEYINKGNKTITEKSFKKNISMIISMAQSFRNAIIELTYPREGVVEKESFAYIINSIYKLFGNYNILIAKKEKDDGMYIFVPKLDSLSLLKTQLYELLQNAIVSYKTITGIELITPKINCVIYPYSAIEDIFSDLMYSERQNDEVNIYIPNKYVGTANEKLLQTSLDHNNISKFISQAHIFDNEAASFHEQIKRAEKLINELSLYLSIDESGVIYFDNETKKYVCQSSCILGKNVKPSFNVGNAIDSKIIERIIEVKDKDGSYLFSNRNNIDSQLGKYLDIFGITGGYIYAINNGTNDNAVGFVYFFNKGASFVFNSYIRESLLVISSTIGYYLKIGSIYDKVVEIKMRETNLMKMANISSYSINKHTHEIVDFTPSFKEEMPNVEKGKICYECFFGYSSPCTHCPLTTKNKVIKEFNKHKVEVSYSINTKVSSSIELIVRQLDENDIMHNKFDADFLVNSYYSFVGRLNNLYTSQSKGYVELLTIDNIKEMISAYGNEGYAFYIRCFTSEVIANIPEINDIFLYKDNTLAFIFTESGRIDIINALEKVYKYSKKDYLGEPDKPKLSIGYETIKYPQEFNTSNDLIRHIEKVLASRNYNIFKTDMIHIEENNFYRPANRKQYILSIIDQAAKSNKFIIKCQPVIKGSNKTVNAGEVLIRLSDDYANTMLNTEELIKVAAENNKLNIISDLLVNYVGNTYKQFGSSIFKAYGFNRMSINVDYNFFKQENFFDVIAQTIETYKFPKNFLTFEVAEDDIATHYDKFKNIVEQLNKTDVDIVCDRYTGEYLSMQKLIALGIKEIKTQRDICTDIDVQTDRFESLKRLVSVAKENNVKVTLVGVENGAQYRLINNYDNTMSMQGYYFYHALEGNELIEVIRKNNQ